jgi:hypothetical protein
MNDVRLHQLRYASAALAIAGSFGCGGSPITSARIERSIAPTFANLVHVQVLWLGLPPTSASAFAVNASCRKPGGGANLGSGEWTCTLAWQGPDKQRLTDTYDLFVTTDGCYTATVATENLGGPTLKAKDGQEVRNLLYAFEGCFDLSGQVSTTPTTKS